MPPPHPEELWTIGRTEEGDMILRLNTALRPFAGRTDHTIQIGVAIPVRNPEPDGYADSVEIAELQATEEIVTEVAAGRARLVGVIMAFAFREYLLYTPTSDWIPEFHEELERRITTHEVQVIAQTDPKWSVYLSFFRQL